MGKRKSSGTSERNNDRVHWTTEIDVVLLNSLIEEQDKGNRVGGTWTTVGLENVARACSEKFHIDIDKEKIISRRRTLKGNYNVCHDLFQGVSGFAWNPETKIFTAEQEVWTDFLQRKPEATKWRYTPVCHYDKLESLFAKDRASGNGGITAKETLREWTSEYPSEVNSEDSSSVPLCLNSSKKPKKRATAEMIEKQTDVFQIGIVGLTEALKEGNRIFKETRPRVYAEEDVYSELVSIGVPKELLVDSMVYLTKNPTEVRALFGVPSELRKEMLFKLMNNHGQ